MKGSELQQRMPAYSPFGSTISAEVEELRDRFRRAMADTLGVAPFPMPVGWAPVVEVAEGDQEFTVTAELPGMSKDDIHVHFEDGMLTIQGEKREERREGDEKRQYHLYERHYGTFTRAFTLPDAVDEGQIKAEFRDGVLRVTLPKAAETKVRGKTIPISA